MRVCIYSVWKYNILTNSIKIKKCEKWKKKMSQVEVALRLLKKKITSQVGLETYNKDKIIAAFWYVIRGTWDMGVNW